MPNSRSHVLTTYSGRQLDLDEVTADAIFIEDIAAALSKICRFGAQARVFYSVAQHAVLVQRILATDLQRPDLSLYGLHHDSHEAFAGDLPSPLKMKINAEGNDAYKRLCDHLDDAISTAYGFSIPADGSEDRAVFERADHTALLIETRALLQDEGAGVRSQLEGNGVDLSAVASSRDLDAPWTPTVAKERFFDAHAPAASNSAAIS